MSNSLYLEYLLRKCLSKRAAPRRPLWIAAVAVSLVLGADATALAKAAEHTLCP